MGRLKSGIPNDLMDMPAEDRKFSDEIGNVPASNIVRENTRFVEIEKVFIFSRYSSRTLI